MRGTRRERIFICKTKCSATLRSERVLGGMAFYNALKMGYDVGDEIVL